MPQLSDPHGLAEEESEPALYEERIIKALERIRLPQTDLSRIINALDPLISASQKAWFEAGARAAKMQRAEHERQPRYRVSEGSIVGPGFDETVPECRDALKGVDGYAQRAILRVINDAYEQGQMDAQGAVRAALGIL